MHLSNFRFVLLVIAVCLMLQPLASVPCSAQETDQAKVARLVQQLKAEDPKVRSSAAEQLAYMGSSASSAVPDLINMAITMASDRTLQAAIDAAER
jgi:HEAT repeat protein